MISRFGLIKRDPALAEAAFLDHWRGVHGPLVAQLPGLRGYNQHLITDASQFGISYPRADWDIDGFSEIQFDTHADMQAAMASAAFPPTVADAANFLQSAKLVCCEKHKVVPAQEDDTPYIKRITLLRRLPHLSAADFRREWLEVHADMVAAWPDVLGYHQNLVVERYNGLDTQADYEDVPIDGIVEFWFRDRATADALFKTEQVAQTQVHGAEFLSDVTTFIVETTRIA